VDVEGIRRPAIVIFAPGQITFENIRIGESPDLAFGVSKLYSIGDGALGFIVIQDGTRRDTVYRRYLNPRDDSSHLRWFDEQISLKQYTGRFVNITFAADAGPQQDNTGDFYAWSVPQLLYMGFEDTPTKRGAFVVLDWEIGGERRDALITLAGTSLTYTLPASRLGEILFFGAGKSYLSGDGAVGMILVEVEGRRDTLFQRYLNPANRPEDRAWFDTQVSLTTYRGREIKIIFEAHPGPARDYNADWFAWSRPRLTLPYR
jgi:hypothetical protein